MANIRNHEDKIKLNIESLFTNKFQEAINLLITDCGDKFASK